MVRKLLLFHYSVGDLPQISAFAFTHEDLVRLQTLDLMHPTRCGAKGGIASLNRAPGGWG